MITYKHMINTINLYGIFSIDFIELNKNVYVYKYMHLLLTAHKEGKKMKIIKPYCTNK